MTVVRQQNRKTVHPFSACDRGELRRLTAGGRNTHDPPGQITEENEIVTAPHAAGSKTPDVADRLRRAAIDVDLLQFSASKENDGLAVGRPERRRRIRRALGSGKQPRLQFAYLLDPHMFDIV